MRLAFFALLSLLPLIEIAVLVKFGQWAGVWVTLAIVIGTAVAGVGILQRQGLAMLLRTQAAVMRGEPPVGAMLEGGMMVMAGMLLIMPGLITDVLGLLLLIPLIRRFIARRAVAGMFGDVRVDVFEEGRKREPPRNGTRTGDGDGPRDGPRDGPADGRADGPVIEGDFERLDERTVDPQQRRPSDKS